MKKILALESEEIMAVRTTAADWKGTLKEGAGTMKVGKDWYDDPFTHASRFASGEDTNPEELISAAHAGCYSMLPSACSPKPPPHASPPLPLCI